MNEASIYRTQVRDMSESLTKEVARVPSDLFNKRPGPGQNPVGWNYFHILRVWDLDFNWLCRGQQPTEDAWHRGGFTEKSGYNPDGKGGLGVGVGYGYTDEEVDEVVISADVLRQYHEMLLNETVEYLEAADNDELRRQAPSLLSPDQPKEVSVQIRHTIGHSYSHIGEIRYAMGILGIHDASYEAAGRRASGS
jgi:hypothetical protein